MSNEDTTTPPSAKGGALVPAVAAVALPTGALLLAWLIAGKIPLAVPVREWGTWFIIEPLIGVAGIVGTVCAIKALARGG